jgi:multidrug efflux pump subunit AcrB
VSQALQRENVILPAGDVKIGGKDYMLTMNNSRDVIAAVNGFPIKQVDGRTVFMHDIANVHDGYQVQTNSVAVDGRPGALMTIRKTGGVSTLAVIDGIRAALPYVNRLMPKGVAIKAIFDQSIFVKAALNSLVMGGAMAAGLTALMILLFLGNWRLTLIITAVLALYMGGQTLNTMTLGGFALAVGILVDNGTVVIENVERHTRTGEHPQDAIINGAGEVGTPTFLSTLSICTVFVPIFLLQGTAKYLFSPLALSVCLSLIASLVLSFTLVPVLFSFLMASTSEAHSESDRLSASGRRNPLTAIHRGFERGFDSFRETYRHSLSWTLSRPALTIAFFGLLMAVSAALFPFLGRDFLPQVDSGQMRLHVRAPPGTRIEQTQVYFTRVEAEIRKIVGDDQIDVILYNIGLPYNMTWRSCTSWAFSARRLHSSARCL